MARQELSAVRGERVEPAPDLLRGWRLRGPLPREPFSGRAGVANPPARADEEGRRHARDARGERGTLADRVAAALARCWITLKGNRRSPAYGTFTPLT